MRENTRPKAIRKNVQAGGESWIIDYLQKVDGNKDWPPLRRAPPTMSEITKGREAQAVKCSEPGVGSNVDRCLSCVAFSCSNSTQGSSPASPDRLSIQINELYTFECYG